MRFFAAILSSFLFSLSSFGAQAAIDRFMSDTIKAWHIPGAAVVVVQDDKVVFVKGYGVREIGGTATVTPDTLFEIASTSKAFTSTALAMLASDKKLDFDDPVRKHLPYFRLSDMCADQSVTLRDIVTHRTGLTRHDELWDNTTLTREDVIRAVAHIPLARPFRTTYQYHNIMFITAGEAIAHASGMSWDDFMRTRVFGPLKMTGTVLSDDEWRMSPNRATGHRHDAKSGRITPRPRIDTATIGPGGAVKSSARDLGNWLRFHLAGGTFEGKQLVDPKLLAETKMPHMVIRLQDSTAELNPETNLQAYAMGWNVSDYRGETMVAHAGALNGARTHVVLLPERNAGFAIMINVERGYSLYAMRHAIADILRDGKPSRDWSAYYLAFDKKTEEKSRKDKEERMSRRVTDTTPTRPLAEYAGTYSNPAYGALQVSIANGQLMLQWQRLNVPLVHFQYDSFHAESPDDGLDEPATFSLDAERKVNSLTFFGERFSRSGS